MQDVIYATALERHHSKVGQDIGGLQEKKELMSHQCLCVLRGILIDGQKKFKIIIIDTEASLVAEMVKNLPAIWETQV